MVHRLTIQLPHLHHPSLSGEPHRIGTVVCAHLFAEQLVVAELLDGISAGEHQIAFQTAGALPCLRIGFRAVHPCDNEGQTGSHCLQRRHAAALPAGWHAEDVRCPQQIRNVRPVAQQVHPLCEVQFLRQLPEKGHIRPLAADDIVQLIQLPQPCHRL